MILVGIVLVVAYTYWPSSWNFYPDSWKFWSSTDEGQDGTSAETAASDSTATDSVATISVEEMIRLEVEKALVEERRQDSIREASPLEGYEYDPTGRIVYLEVIDTLNDGRVFVSREKGPAWRKKQ